MNQAEDIEESSLPEKREQTLDPPLQEETLEKTVFSEGSLDVELQRLQEEFAQKNANTETKLERLLQFMELSLAEHHPPRFRSFWQAREACFFLFKENIPQLVRYPLWSRYTELSKEARRLKEMLDEQSAFASEQIDIAIRALEADLSQTQQRQSAVIQSLSLKSQIMEPHFPQYVQQQGELDFLNLHAARINALRKELIKTEMRARKKNLFFQRLSSLGDKVFPRRKELIHRVSEQFVKDIEGFIAEHFSTARVRAPFYFLREEIKALQIMAKSLTLNTHAFNHTRLQLSQCWDKIKELEKEHKKEQAQQRIVHAEQMQLVQQRVDDVALKVQEQKIPLNDAINTLDSIATSLRHQDWERDELKALRHHIHQARSTIQEIIDREAQEKYKQEQERIRGIQQKITDLKQEISLLIQNAPKETAEELLLRREEFQQKIQSLAITKTEKLELERLLKPLKDLISDKKEQSLILLSEDDRHALAQLHEVLQQRKQRRQEVKESLDQLRKASAVSGLDFERAMTYQAQMNEEKDRLEKVNQGIEEVEKKLAQME
jgi:hypothetical protein